MSSTPDDPHRYDDIIGLPHPVSRKHPRMPLENRAAQFAPFAALTGYDAAIQEKARLTDKRIELDEDEKAKISDRLQLIQEHIEAHLDVTITFFQPDGRKDGGAYVDIAGCIKKIDVLERVIVMTNGKVIPIDDVVAVTGELFRGIDEGFA